MNAAADETFEFQVRGWGGGGRNAGRSGPGRGAQNRSACFSADGAAGQQRLDHQERPVAAHRQQEGGDRWRGDLLQQERREAFR